jgi:hypothetical protein
VAPQEIEIKIRLVKIKSPIVEYYIKSLLVISDPDSAMTETRIEFISW